MRKSHLLGAVCGCLAFVSFNVNAVVLNTLGGVDYEWLELSETAGLSRDQVELKLADPNDPLYGYEYASRQLAKELLYSYSSWDLKNGYHGDSSVVAGLANFVDDFGLPVYAGDGVTEGRNTIDGYTRFVDGYMGAIGIYGESDECGGVDFSCELIMILETFIDGSPATAYQWQYAGWSTSTSIAVGWLESDSVITEGSYLVKAATVPIPPPLYLFGSGLLGLAGMTRRRKA